MRKKIEACFKVEKKIENLAYFQVKLMNTIECNANLKLIGFLNKIYRLLKFSLEI